MRKVKGDHPTRIALLECGVSLANEFGMYGFTVEQLLTTSGISKGSLYHHFEDFVDLVECVQVRLFAEYVDADIAAMRSAFGAATDKPTFKKIMFSIAETAYLPQRVKSRADRARIISATEGRERFAQRVGHEQKLLSDELAEVIRKGQELGWVNTTISAEALSLFVQAYTFGLILNNVSEAPVDIDAWLEIIRSVIDQVIMSD